MYGTLSEENGILFGETELCLRTDLIGFSS